MRGRLDSSRTSGGDAAASGWWDAREGGLRSASDADLFGDRSTGTRAAVPCLSAMEARSRSTSAALGSGVNTAGPRGASTVATA